MDEDMKKIEIEQEKKQKKKIFKKWWFWISILIVAIVITSIILLICNQKSKNIGYQLSELIPSTSANMPHLKGSIKNISNTSCKEVKINVEISNGTIKEDGWITVDSPEIGEIESFDTLLFIDSDLNNIENYKVKLKNIECYEEKKNLSAKSFKKGDTLSATELEDYFEDIYKKHTSNGIAMTTGLEEIHYPYIEEATYNNDEIEIKYSAKYKNSSINVTEKYNTTSSELIRLFVFITNTDDDVDSKIKSSISFALSNDSSSSLSILRALNTTLERDEYMSAGGWKISYIEDDMDKVGIAKMYSIYK